VYEVLKTSDAASAVVKPPQVLGSIIMFSLVYLLLAALFLFLLFRMIQKGPTAQVAGLDLPETWQPLSLKSGRQTEG
jgi:cytochrome d ubiquinol oxidase subunit I